MVIKDNPKGRYSAPLFIIPLLCIAFYLLGAWQKSGTGKGDSIAQLVTRTSEECGSIPNIEFETHHGIKYTNTNSSVFKVRFFKLCDEAYTDYTPCHENMYHHLERRCPPREEKLRCLVPAPRGYVTPYRWPKSRDYVPFVNVPYRSLTEGKGVQSWVQYEGNVFKFPDRGAEFPHGVEAYMDQLASVIPIDDGTIRTALDTGCGVASFGAYLTRKNVITMSFSSRDSHEAQVLFALERGVPAVIGTLRTVKLPYPSRAFDMVHCSRCMIPWGDNDGKYMMEIDRVLRPGGYWIFSGPPINWRNNHRAWQQLKEELEEEQKKIEDIAGLLCWEKIYEKNETAIWRKKINSEYCSDREDRVTMCRAADADDVWYKKMKSCVTPYPGTSTPEEVAGGELQPFPRRLNSVPPRITNGGISGVSADSFKEDNVLWKKHVNAYKRINKLLDTGRYRNVLDMNAGLGSFAAALESPKLWVMNVMPTIAAKDTLGVIYERGLIGIYHDWCEAFSTFPRSYDLIHAEGVFSLYKDKCKMEDILLEMDRILRPEGAVIFRDHADVLSFVRLTVAGMKWNFKTFDHEDGPLVPEKMLVAVKQYHSV